MSSHSDVIQQRFRDVLESQGFPNPRECKYDSATRTLTGDHALLMAVIKSKLGEGMQNGIIQCQDSDWYRLSPHDTRILEKNMAQQQTNSFAHHIATSVQASHVR